MTRQETTTPRLYTVTVETKTGRKRWLDTWIVLADNAEVARADVLGRTTLLPGERVVRVAVSEEDRTAIKTDGRALRSGEKTVPA